MRKQAIKLTRKISFSSSSNNDPDFKSKVLHAEVKHTNPLAQHNIPLVAADHPATPYKELLPDSKIAQNFKHSHQNYMHSESGCEAITTKWVNRAYAQVL